MSLAPLLMSLSLAAAISQLATETTGNKRIPLGLDFYMPVPDDNPLTAETIALGRRLFSDRLLSRDGTTACRSCHEPDRAFTDGRSVAVGLDGRTGTRSSPTLVNRGYGRVFFWDGRASTLEEQVVQPIVNPNELDLTLDELVVRLRDKPDYAKGFVGAFGRPVNDSDVARALASYVRTIVSGDAPVDRYLAGEGAALSAEARRGLAVFRGRANCTACHVGPTFSDEQFHNTGVAWKEAALTDVGRFAITGRDADRGAFKTPTLREIARTAPYMHDGSFPTLDDVVDFYNRGGNANPVIDPELHPLDLSGDEKRDLLALLRAFNGTIQEGF